MEIWKKMRVGVFSEYSVVVEWLCHDSRKHWVDYRVTLSQSCLHWWWPLPPTLNPDRKTSSSFWQSLCFHGWFSESRTVVEFIEDFFACMENDKSWKMIIKSSFNHCSGIKWLKGDALLLAAKTRQLLYWCVVILIALYNNNNDHGRGGSWQSRF